MKLINCYVSSFGKLKDFSFDFDGALNTIKEDNGWGKSTFASFIKSMFYGLSGSKQHGLEDNERKRFAPWNSTEKFGGNLTFEWKGQRFKIERFFGAKSSDDVIKLYDLSTGKVYTEGQAVENLGKRVFSIDEEGFLSTTYFSQKDFEIKSNTSITAKFNEVCEIQDSDAFDRALEKIESKIKDFKSRGDKGKIAEIKRAITALDDEIERTKQSVKTVDGLKKESDIIKGETLTLESNIKALTARLEAAGKRDAALERKKRYDALTAEIKELEIKMFDADDVLNGKSVSVVQIEDCEKCIRDLYDLNIKEETLKLDVAEYEQAKPVEQPRAKSKLPLIFTIIAVLFAVAGGVIAAMGKLWGLFFIGAGVIAALFAGANYVFSKRKTADERNGDGKFAEIYERKKRALYECEENKIALTKGLNAYFSGFKFSENGLSYQSKLDVLKDAVKTREECLRAIAKCRTELKNLSALGITENDEKSESVSELNEKLKTATDWYKTKASEYERLKMRIDALEVAADALIDAENRRVELKTKLEDSEHELKILTLTANFMRRADETLKTRYRAPLQESLNKYLKMIAGTNISATIDTDMKVSINVGGAERETEFFSKGYKNLFEICKRFALTDILFTAEKPFIILDDPFYNLDDEKVSAATALLKRLSEEYQILYLVCHESRRA